MDERIKEILRLGRDAYKKKEYSRAESYLTEVLEKHDGFADVHNMLGVICHDRGLFSKAQDHFERALAINPGYTEAALNLAVTYNDLGRYEDAKRVYGEALARSQAVPGELDPFVRGKISNMYAEIGDVFASSGLYDEASVEFEKALSLAPGFVDIRLKLAQSLRDSGKHESAIEQFRRILADRPGYVAARVHLGITLYATGKIAEAVKEWEEVLRQDPENGSCRMYLNLVSEVAPGKVPEGGS
jgi:tetratricopeptide (TPR) repeat protein